MLSYLVIHGTSFQVCTNQLVFFRMERIYIAQSTVQTLFTNKTLEINHITTQLQSR
jgi:hypothetical protein